MMAMLELGKNFQGGSMKPNSCLYRATASVCQEQFGLDVSYSSHIFDHYNIKGDGIPIHDIAIVIDTALEPWGISIDAIYGNIVGEFSHRHKCRGPGRVGAPCIGILPDGVHAVPILEGNGWIECVLGITLRRHP
jgi:hypothetical protein